MSEHEKKYSGSITSTWTMDKEMQENREIDHLLREMLTAPQCTLRRIVQGEDSGWLTVLPLAADGYDMSATQFGDQLAVHYHHEPAGLPAVCDGCGASLSLQHGLDCAKGGLVKKGHNDLHDNDAQLADIAWGGLAVEPMLMPENDRRGQPGDCCKPTGWHGGLGGQPGGVYFYNRITDADVPGYVRSNRLWEAISNKAALEKKAKHRHIAEEMRPASITPLVCSTDAVLHHEYIAYQKRLTSRLTTKWDKPYSSVMAWVRVQTHFAVFRAVDMRVRGTRR